MTDQTPDPQTPQADPWANIKPALACLSALVTQREQERDAKVGWSV